MSALFDQEDFDDFESSCLSNGFTYWYSTDLAKFLGYETWASFRKVIQKAIAACLQTGIPLEDNILSCKAAQSDKFVEDFKLSRFGCYLVTMNAHPSKPGVA
jgi:DNA-damage-inducible protein D